jgi:hypothetical protein
MSNIYYLHVVTSVTIDGSKSVAGGISGEDGCCEKLSNAEGWITTMVL